MQLLRPLLLDVVPNIQQVYRVVRSAPPFIPLSPPQTAALALGRLANHNGDLAEAIVKGDILPQLVTSLAEQNVKSTDS